MVQLTRREEYLKELGELHSALSYCFITQKQFDEKIEKLCVEYADEVEIIRKIVKS